MNTVEYPQKTIEGWLIFFVRKYSDTIFSLKEDMYFVGDIQS